MVNFALIFFTLFQGAGNIPFSMPAVQNSSPLIDIRGEHTWTTNGPYGGFILDVEALGNTVYIGLIANGVYRLNNAGYWQPRRDSIRFFNIQCIAGIDPTHLLAGTERVGLWFTVDGGLTWQQNNTVPVNSTVRDIFRYTPDTLFLCTEVHGVYSSRDSGATWTHLNSLLDSLYYTCFTRNPAGPAIYLGTEGYGIFKSINAGLTWNNYSTPAADVEVLKYYIDSSSLEYLYAGCSDGLYIQHLPDTTTWDTISTASTHISDIARKGDTVFVATMGAGILVGLLGDTLFQQSNQGLPYLVVNSIEVAGDTILIGTSGGFFYSGDNGLHWYERNDSLNANASYDIKTNSLSFQSVYTVTLGGGLYKSSDNGESWFRYGVIPNIPYFSSMAVNPLDSANILIGSFLGVYRTTNSGASWQFSYLGYRVVSTIEFDPTNPVVAYAATSDQFYRSTDNGQSWIPVDSGLYYNDIATSVNLPGTIYIATDHGVFRSDDYGATIYQIGLPDTAVVSVAIDGYYPNLIYAGLQWVNTGVSGVRRSSDGGFTWTPTGFPDLACYDIETLYDVPFFVNAVASDCQCFQSLDGGSSWFALGPIFNGNEAHSLTFNHALHSLFLGNYTGVYVYTDTTRPSVSITSVDSFTPDGDSINDEIVFYTSASDTHGILYWNAKILRDTVEFINMEGIGIPPDSIIWDGFDSTGVLLKDGIYQARLYVYDGFFNLDSATKVFTLHKEPMISGNEDATSFPAGRKIAVDYNGTIHAVYSTFSPGEIFYTTSVDGINWSEPLDLSNSRHEFSVNPLIVIDSNIVYVFWEEEAADSHEIFWQRSADGNWFPSPRRLSRTEGPSVFPSAVATSDRDIHLVWAEKANGEIFYAHYDFSSGFWDSVINISGTVDESRDPFILNLNGIYVFFSDKTNQPNFDIRYRRWDGSNWLAESTLTSTPGNSFSSMGVADQLGRIHFFWVDTTPGNYEIYYKQFIPNSGWSADTNISQTPYKSNHPTVSLDASGNVYLFWEDSIDIYRKVLDHQLGWLPAENISQSSVKSLYPSSSFGGDLVWTEGDSTPYDIIYYKDLIPDTTDPAFVITAPETTYLNDTLHITFSVDEEIQGLPEAWLKSAVAESLAFTITFDSSYYYSGDVLVSGITPGSGVVLVRGNDLAGNSGYNERAIFIDSVDIVPPAFSITAPDTTYLTDTLRISFVVSEQLSGMPSAWLFDNMSDSLQFDTLQLDSALHYSGRVFVDNSVLSAGMGNIRIRGTDLHGNPGTTDSSIYIHSILLPDTIPPEFAYSPETLYIGDLSMILFTSSEVLDSLPIVWLTDTTGDSLRLDVTQDSSQGSLHFFSAVDTIIGLAIGEAQLDIFGSDTAGNSTDTSYTVWIDTKGNLLPRDSCFAFPNPTRKDYVKFMFYLNQNAFLKIDIFTLSGRKIYSIEEQYFEGGRLYETTMSVADLGSDIYIFRATARTDNEEAIVMKKFGVIK
ncbi:MAG TPA: hypothetical protein ENI34_07605 [candidate division WOR-3 bacterium]|uniref:T9SS type A sorting domain-containing protein n=1 Tax=candidate division WOR-3 bacterium TaxID=2052148 RepID=A0A9C9K0E7_UNCW3|nr:hypothetical protein [candidate division WOR-3 bacterium]